MHESPHALPLVHVLQHPDESIEIGIESVHPNKIMQNNLRNNSFCGVNIRISSKNNILGNTIRDNNIGIHVPSEKYENHVSDNIFSNNDKDIENAASVRATLSTWNLSQSFTTLRKDSTVSIDDIRKAARVALRGRVAIAPESPYFEHPAEYIQSLVDSVLNNN